MTDKIEKAKINTLISFENHPFKTRMGEEKNELLESIRANCTLVPIIVRSSSDGKYEIILIAYIIHRSIIFVHKTNSQRRKMKQKF